MQQGDQDGQTQQVEAQIQDQDCLKRVREPDELRDDQPQRPGQSPGEKDPQEDQPAEQLIFSKSYESVFFIHGVVI